MIPISTTGSLAKSKYIYLFSAFWNHKVLHTKQNQQWQKKKIKWNKTIKWNEILPKCQF